MRSGATSRLVFLVLAVAINVAVALNVQQCPSGFELVRRGQGISESEARYVSDRRKKVLPAAFKTYLKNVQRTGVSLPKYVADILESKERLPTVGISTSGGGYRAALFGAGVVNALDGRNSSAVEKGTGGLLQTVTHLAALSGGSWFMTSLAQANFPTIQHLIFGDGHAGNFAGWNPEVDLFPSTATPTEQLLYASELLQELAVKAQHFPVSLGDVWGRALARHFTNGTDPVNFFANTTHGVDILFSDLLKLPTFNSHEQPVPIIVTDLVSEHINGSIFPGGYAIPLNTPMFEFNPFETGSYDYAVAAHTPTKYLGTTNKSVCVTGFDQAMFISGTSSNLFNEANVTVGRPLLTDFGSHTPPHRPPPSPLPPPTSRLSSIRPTRSQCGSTRVTTRIQFHGVAPKTFSDSGETMLTMCDGGEDGQVSPLQPMLVKDRNIDVIIEIDAVSVSSYSLLSVLSQWQNNDDGHGWALGSSLIATQERMKIFQRGLRAFPCVPTNQSGFISAGLLKRPTFFGCSPPSSLPHWPFGKYEPKHEGPLVVYIANGAPPRDGSAPVTNTSTQQTVYSGVEMQGMLGQAFDVATQGADLGLDLVDEEWGACLACAVVDRARAREGVRRSGVCERCFERYCWQG
ncbi:lysophospholipase [Roridomyces roridus]|uniref:Lysophospholipase n=1 Tax=Roridomyces roridus TaxID=1738132 RepID=A0AAD7BKJ3_9AGAR|nr:lysophospholipase [Roridomyces roridus]